MTDAEQPHAGPSNPHRMRIAQHGDIKTYVRFALEHLTNSPDQPITFHTLPAEDNANKQIPAISKPHPSTLSISKLVSVVEIVKREHTKRARGLWQYTEAGLVPQPDDVAAAAPLSLEQVLSGKTKPKLSHHPYLQITLATSRQEDLEKKPNVTYQPVRPAKTTKKAKEINEVTPQRQPKRPLDASQEVAAVKKRKIVTTEEEEPEEIETPLTASQLSRLKKRKS